MISASKIENDCKPCKRRSFVEHKKSVGFLPGILLALLPKCPFCFMAFSSTMILCEEGGTHIAQRSFSSTTTIYYSLFFCVVTFLCILFNYRDGRTKYAIALAFLGTFSVALSVAVKGGLPLYYFGVFLIFSGVWLNAGLLNFIKKINGYINRQKTEVNTISYKT